jgi:hypothetical protein
MSELVVVVGLILAEAVEKVAGRLKARNFLPTGRYCASSTREGAGRCTQNAVLTARRAVEMASGAVPPLHYQNRQILAPPDSRLYLTPSASKRHSMLR